VEEPPKIACANQSTTVFISKPCKLMSTSGLDIRVRTKCQIPSLESCEEFYYSVSQLQSCGSWCSLASMLVEDIW
jgi:hypothetical protein